MEENNVLYSSYGPLPTYDCNSLIELLIDKSKEHALEGKTMWMTDALTGDSLDYASFDDFTKRIGSYMYKRGMRKGDIVIFMTVDILKQPIFLGGVWRANGICRASYPEDDADTLLSRVKESRSGWIYCEAVHAPMCLRVAEKIYWNVDVEIIVASKEPVEGCTTIYEVMDDDGAELPKLDAVLEDPALIMCTSGTTGLSKGAVISQAAVIWMASSVAQGIPLFEDKANLVFTKGTHISGAMVPFAGLLSGQGGLYLTFITRQRILDAVDKYKPGFIFGFPTFLLMLVNDPEAQKMDLSSLEIMGSGGAPVTPAVVQALMTLPSLKSVINVYGLTECAPLITNFDFNLKEVVTERPEASVGRLVPETKAQFLDVETGLPVELGQIGELCVKCPGLFTEYYLTPDATEKAFIDGFFKTGDVGYCDENGYIFLVDRAKEIFKYFNNHIAPTELENIILQHPSIAEVCVIGIPDPDGGGYIPRAFCVTQPESEVTTEEVLEYANDKLAGYKHLRGGVYFVPELPKGKTGKVTRQLVEKMQVG